MVAIPKFTIKGLKAAHDKLGLSPYMVSKKTGIAIGTIDRYTSEDEVSTARVEGSLIALIKFYGLDWRDPTVVELAFEETPTEGQRKTLLALA